VQLRYAFQCAGRSSRRVDGVDRRGGHRHGRQHEAAALLRVGRAAARARSDASRLRDYGDDAAARVGFIRQAQASWLTLAHIAEVLAVRDDGRAPCRHLATLVEDRLEKITTRLLKLEHSRTELLARGDRLDALDPADCRDGDICAAVPGSRAGRPD
jgi:DNA-binding transcriptional MerR regulator